MKAVQGRGLRAGSRPAWDSRLRDAMLQPDKIFMEKLWVATIDFAGMKMIFYKYPSRKSMEGRALPKGQTRLCFAGGPGAFGGVRVSEPDGGRDRT